MFTYRDLASDPPNYVKMPLWIFLLYTNPSFKINKFKLTKLESPWSVTTLGSGDLFFILTILYPLNYFLTYEWFKFNVCQHLNVCTLVTTDRGPFHGLYVLARTDGILALQSGLAPACLYQVRKTFWHYPTFFLSVACLTFKVVYLFILSFIYTQTFIYECKQDNNYFN